MDCFCQRQEGFAELPAEERMLVPQFAIMWTYFEAKVCGTDEKPAVLLDVAQELAKDEVIELEW